MPRMVHLGVGNFHRAHQAWYTQAAGGWDVTGVIMSNRELYNALKESGGRYLLGIWAADGLATRTISVHDDILLAADAPEAVIARIAYPETRIVTLTITEKGYCLASNGLLDFADPAIEADIAAEAPSSAIGLLAAGLHRRAGQGGKPITILSCDNLSANGRKLRQAVSDFLGAKAPSALDWLGENAAFPDTMVDRITPRLSDTAKAEISAAAGDGALTVVGTEAFSEWIIEDRFAAARPDWERAGAVFTADVGSFERRKLRLLNAAHSYLACAGQAAGHRFVHEAIADEKLRSHVESLWDEAQTTLSPPALDTVPAYREALLERFSVPDLRHELRQIAADGSLKLKERLVPVLQERAEKGLASPHVEGAIDAWIDHARDAIARGERLADPNADRIAGMAAGMAAGGEAFDEEMRRLIGL